MAHRERAKSRLDRRIPGEKIRQVSPIEALIVYRTRPIESFELNNPYGEALLERSDRTEKPAKTIDPSPNAPLLIRLVRDPYALETASWTRTTVRDVSPTVSRAADPFPNAMAEWRKSSFRGFMGNPARGLMIGPSARVSPTAISFAQATRRRSCQ